MFARVPPDSAYGADVVLIHVGRVSDNRTHTVNVGVSAYELHLGVAVEHIEESRPFGCIPELTVTGGSVGVHQRNMHADYNRCTLVNIRQILSYPLHNVVAETCAVVALAHQRVIVG